MSSVDRALLDTDTLSEVLKGVNANVLTKAKLYVAEHRVLTFTSVTVYEILTGLEKNQMQARAEAVKQVFRQNEEIVSESGDYELAAQVLGSLRRNGREVGYSDPLVAACAMRRGLAVVTGNQKHFRFIQEVGFELALEDWRNG